MDSIIMKGMRFFGHHGVLAEEREQGQVFVVDLQLFMDLKPAGDSDDLGLTVSYAEVFEAVEEVVSGKPFNLIEALAERVAGVVLERFQPVREVKVTLKKPQAPIQGAFEYMAAEITRSRGVNTGPF
ncbi:MAG: dienelactone hydrolase [Peptococcaceae bacterium BICA1-7]|nr:MAG: dienelactone hydrolase [Peptococcaceae bacterium BICA1-7]HBV99306.1 dihydroneopterin aldolase [Desulfotomaculum sp.]